MWSPVRFLDFSFPIGVGLWDGKGALAVTEPASISPSGIAITAVVSWEFVSGISESSVEIVYILIPSEME